MKCLLLHGSSCCVLSLYLSCLFYVCLFCCLSSSANAYNPFSLFEDEPQETVTSRQHQDFCPASLLSCQRRLFRFGRRLASPQRPLTDIADETGPHQTSIHDEQRRRKVEAVCRRGEPWRMELAYMRRHVSRTLRLLGLVRPSVDSSDSRSSSANQHPDQDDDWDQDGSQMMLEDDEVDSGFWRRQYSIHLSLNSEQLAELADFLQHSDSPSLLGRADSILSEAMASGQLHTALVDGVPRWLWRLQFLATFECWLAVILVSGGVWLCAGLARGHSWFHLAAGGVFFALLASCLCTWQRMYQQALVRRHAALTSSSDLPAACRPDEASWLQGLGYYVRTFFSFTTAGDECMRYREMLVVDPLWEVTPGDAIAETLSQFVLAPAKHVGAAFGHFYAELAAHTPTLWFLPLAVLSLLFILVLVALLLGYQLRLPFWLGSVSSAAATATRVGPCVECQSSTALHYVQVSLDTLPASMSAAGDLARPTELRFMVTKNGSICPLGDSRAFYRHVSVKPAAANESVSIDGAAVSRLSVCDDMAKCNLIGYLRTIGGAVMSVLKALLYVPVLLLRSVFVILYYALSIIYTFVCFLLRFVTKEGKKYDVRVTSSPVDQSANRTLNDDTPVDQSANIELCDVTPVDQSANIELCDVTPVDQSANIELCDVTPVDQSVNRTLNDAKCPAQSNESVVESRDVLSRNSRQDTANNVRDFELIENQTQSQDESISNQRSNGNCPPAITSRQEAEISNLPASKESQKKPQSPFLRQLQDMAFDQ